MKKLLSSELSLRIISVFIAILLWMYVISIRNPQVEITFRGIPISVSEETAIKANGLEVVQQSANYADVKIKGRRSEVANVAAEDIKVETTGQSIDDPGTYELTTRAAVDGSGVSVSEVSVQTFQVVVDYIVVKEKPIKVETTGKPKEGYLSLTPVTQITVLNVQGPKNRVDQVSYARVAVPIEGVDKKVNQAYRIDLIDQSGNVMDLTHLILSTRDVMVEIPIYKTKQLELKPVYLNGFDPAAANYDVTISPQYITVYGEKELIDNLTVIETQPIDGTQISSQEELLIQPVLMVPENVFVQDSTVKPELKFTRRSDMQIGG